MERNGSHFPKNDEKFMRLCLPLKENKFTVTSPGSAKLGAALSYPQDGS
jgi:hypothetical protein